MEVVTPILLQHANRLRNYVLCVVHMWTLTVLLQEDYVGTVRAVRPGSDFQTLHPPKANPSVAIH